MPSSTRIPRWQLQSVLASLVDIQSHCAVRRKASRARLMERQTWARAANDYQCDEYQTINAVSFSSASNEKEISHGRVPWQTR